MAVTRKTILTAARTLFAEHGFDGVGVREIAQRAGVDHALTIRYFGSKAKLFQAAFEERSTLFDLAMADRSLFGSVLAKQVIGHTVSDECLMAILRTTWRPESEAAVAGLMDEVLVAPLAAWIGGDGAWNRATLIVTMVGAVEMVREKRLGRDCEAAESAGLADILAPQLQALVDGQVTKTSPAKSG